MGCIQPESEYLYIACPLEKFGEVQRVLEKLEVPIDTASLQYTPHTYLNLEKGAMEKVMKLIEALEDLEDVQKVSHNMAFNE